MKRGDRSLGSDRRPTLAIAAALSTALLIPAAPGLAQTEPKVFPSIPHGLAVSALPEWLHRETDIPPQSVVFISQGVIVVLEHRPAAITPDQPVRVQIRREATTPQAIGIVGGRSDQVQLELNCRSGLYRIVRADVYAGNGLTGRSKVVVPVEVWTVAKPNADMFYILNATCDRNYRSPLPAYSGGAPLRGEAAPRTPDPAVPPTRTASTPWPPGAVAQVSAANSEQLARASLADVVRRLPQAAVRPTRIEVATAGGKTHYRAQFGGFGSRADADRFCKQVRAAGGDCIVK